LLVKIGRFLLGLLLKVTSWNGKKGQKRGISSITYVTLVAGGKNHHRKSVSTPQQLFTQQDFEGCNPFSVQSHSFKSPTSSAKPNPAIKPVQSSKTACRACYQ
jgi:hypothetical protein